MQVFNTWDSDRRSKTDQATPISSEVISKLKQTSRLLHYCSSSVWLLSKSYVSNLPETVSEQVYNVVGVASLGIIVGVIFYDSSSAAILR